MKKKAILLDHDGTIIVDRIYLNDPDAIEYLPGVFEALRQMRDLGFYFSVVTNQSGVPRGLVDVKNLDEIHRRIRADFARRGVDILSFHYAPYMTDSNHYYRKPRAGMLLEAARFYNYDLSQSWMIGDRMSDVEAGHQAGTRSVLLEGLENPVDFPYAPPDLIAKDLLQVARFLRAFSSQDFRDMTNR
ncbi:MAG: HAD family hydrolase [Bdellovibrionales bacterium]|nr:HAD family hydrolase [Bdellovibrionales bacterium]